MTAWTIKMEEHLARLWDEPISLKEVGEKLSPESPIPPSTLSQKARRLGLGKRAHPQTSHWRKHLDERTSEPVVEVKAKSKAKPKKAAPKTVAKPSRTTSKKAGR